MSESRPNLYGLSRDEIDQALNGLTGGPFPSFHSQQIYRWLYKRRILDPELWTDLPQALRRNITGSLKVDPGTIDQQVESEVGAVKYTIRLSDDNQVEAVYMLHEDRVTLCLSSQCGCALGCTFCLTARMGLRRNLTAGEIIGQVHLILADRELADRPCNIVYMGMGEPLQNYDAMIASFRILTDPEGPGWSRKRITLSTAGLAPAILRLAEEPLQPRLAVSLNATTDTVRDQLMPINRKYPLAELLNACSKFSDGARNPMTFEYVLLAGVNDSDDDIRRLARIVLRQRVKLNLIPFNAVPEWLDYQPPRRERILELRDQLLKMKVPVSIRWSRGSDARAACGQLAMLG